MNYCAELPVLVLWSYWVGYLHCCYHSICNTRRTHIVSECGIYMIMTHT